MKICTPTLSEQDCALVGAALDCLLRQHGLAQCAQVAALMAKLEAAMKDDGPAPVNNPSEKPE